MSAKRATTDKSKAPAETIKVTITDLDKEGVGTAIVDNRIALVQGAFPSETVIAEVQHRGRTHIYTKLQRVLWQSQQRTAATNCSLEQTCLGCPLISMKYDAQLQFKQQRVATAIHQQLPDNTVAVKPVLPCPEPFAYRTSAKLVFSRKRDKVRLGLYQRGSHDVVDCPDCPVHHPLINRIATIVRDDVSRQGVSIYNPRHNHGLLRYLVIRVSPDSSRALVTFVCRHRDYQDLPKLAKKLTKKMPEVIGVHQNVNSSAGNVILGSETIKLLGYPDLIEQVGDIRLHIAPESFFQINTRQAARMYQLICDWAQLTRKDTALDLFCGIGGIALNLARHAGSVQGIELVPEAIRNANANAALNNLTNCRFSAGDATEQLQLIAAGSQPPPTLVTVNPPRKGCGKELLQQLIKLRPPRIIYISCDPDTLALDLRQLLAGGYRLKGLQPVDMFPQTAHIETVALLQMIETTG